jgi:hypothetical protein
MASRVEESEPGCLSYGIFSGKEGEVLIIQRYSPD